jgi:hypothetical protein
MLPFEDRFTRQRQLPEVGLRVQELLASAPGVVVRVGAIAVPSAIDPGDVARIYLERAGVPVVRQRANERTASSALDPERDFPHAQHFQFAGPRSFAAGAHLALGEIRRRLELDQVSSGSR